MKPHQPERCIDFVQGTVGVDPKIVFLAPEPSDVVPSSPVRV
jgi:hypothetical protein